MSIALVKFVPKLRSFKKLARIF